MQQKGNKYFPQKEEKPVWERETVLSIQISRIPAAIKLKRENRKRKTKSLQYLNRNMIIQIKGGRHEQHAVEPVHDSAVAGNEVAVVFGSKTAFDNGGRQIA